MTLQVPRQLSNNFEWVPSLALRQWVSAVTDGINSIGAPWRAQSVRYAIPDGVNTSPSEVGMGWGAYGAFSSAAVAASTNLLTSYPRLVATTSALANNHKQQASNYAHYWLGNAAGMGGFRIEMTWGVVTTAANMRTAVGLGASVPDLAAGDASAHVSCIFMGCDDTDTQMQLMHNDSAGTCTKIPLGADFPKSNNVVYRLTLEAAAMATVVDYTVARLDSAFAVRGSIATNLPASTAFMQPFLVVGNGATASAASIAFLRFMSES